MSTVDAIRNGAARHDELIRQIGELDHAPPALQAQQEHVAGLETRLCNVKINIAKFEKKTEREKKEHRDVKDSIVRKLTYRMTGKGDKFKERITKEEKEFADALAKEMRAKDWAETLQGMLDEAIKVMQDLAAKTAHHTELKSQLDQLYSSIFDGPTSEFPMDDQLERTLLQAQQQHDQIQQRLNKESQVVDLLQRADDCCSRAEVQMKEALDYSTWDMFGGGVCADMAERNALNAAMSLAAQAEMMVHQASMQANKPGDVQLVPALQLPQISSFGDVLFDNIITDMNAHDKIEKSAAQLRAAHEMVKAQLASARARADAVGNDLVQASDKLSSARTELAAYRKNIIAHVAHGNDNSANAQPAPRYAPPPYLPAGEPIPISEGPSLGNRYAAHPACAGAGETSPGS
ncbi:hypothetical protein CONPUDRAFT_83920 [Coniophora puteana RWD-64-598 SS2]|uniref:Uncharacterized protein n=1 Tax=Coniophora puteana (strain RWD-64-598) TaxID=741705 RepID=A0A5M3MH44_CONPW|nr:uncharacterized protein CONPUDRAFT_83920 [Coniophora puteana RWD-64-598 SS2]EIW78549.1 hypothetical protein CONPUDRAFT_83920 [Coniophora puteana RWD-64-598 SS2]